MSLQFQEGPVIACSTGMHANTAIAVIRITGFKDLGDLTALFDKDLNSVKPRIATLCNLINKTQILDQVVLTFFKAPHSYTGENVLEISVHGNHLKIKRCMNVFVEMNLCKLALPGEFTYRALKNKKISLSQVEGLDLFLNANSSLMLDQGMQTLQGELHEQYVKLAQIFTKLKASVELSIDFLEDVGEENAKRQLDENAKKFSDIINSLHARSIGDYSTLLTPTIALVGKTNAGKSSLFNKILSNDRSIVSSVEGTTRDYVSEYIVKEGINFQLLDTAGLRNSTDSIELEGIKRAYALIEKAFVKILVINPFNLSNENDETFSSVKNLVFDILIVTHCDIKSYSTALEKLPKYLKFKAIFPVSLVDGPIEPAKFTKFGPIEPFLSGPIEPVSQKFSGSMGAENLNGPMGPVELLSDISQILEFSYRKYLKIGSTNPILIERHRQVLSSIYSEFNKFQSLTDEEQDIAIISSELGVLEGYVSELIGFISPDDVLGSIFSNFCIGK